MVLAEELQIGAIPKYSLSTNMSTEKTSVKPNKNKTKAISENGQETSVTPKKQKKLP